MGTITSRIYFYNYNITKKEFCKFSIDDPNEAAEFKKIIAKENKKLFKLTKWDPSDLIVQVMAGRYNSITISDTQKFTPYPTFLNETTEYEGPYIQYNSTNEEHKEHLGYDGTNIINSITIFHKPTKQLQTYLDTEFVTITKKVLILHHNLSKLQFITSTIVAHHTDISTIDQIIATQNIDTILTQGEWNRASSKRKADEVDIPTIQKNVIVQTIIDYSTNPLTSKIKFCRGFDLNTKYSATSGICKILHKYTKPISHMLPNVLNKVYTIETSTKAFEPDDFEEDDVPMLNTIIVLDQHNKKTTYKHEDFGLIKEIRSQYNNFS